MRSNELPTTKGYLALGTLRPTLEEIGNLGPDSIHHYG